MAGEPSPKRRLKPIEEWPSLDLWLCVTSFPLGAIVVWAMTMSAGLFYGDWDRWLMGALLAFMLVIFTTPALLRFSIPAGCELWRRWRNRSSAEPGAAPDRRGM